MADANGSSGEGYAGAAVMCLSELEHPGPAATALGAFSVFFSTLVGTPQAYKIYKLKSARGVSFLTLGLGNIGSFLYVLNLTILHYNQITLSLSRDFAFWAKAQRSLVFVWVELFNAISMLAIYPVAAYYVRDDPCPLRVPSLGIDWEMGMKDAAFYWFLAQALIVFLAWFPAAVVLSVDGRCDGDARGASSLSPTPSSPILLSIPPRAAPRTSPLTSPHLTSPHPSSPGSPSVSLLVVSRTRCEPLMVYGNLVGLAVAIIIVCKFLPQLHASLRAKGSHSLSYLTYGVDAAAGVVAWAQKVFITKERISSWLPPLFLHALEVTVLSLNYYHDERRRRGEGGYEPVSGDGGRRRRRDSGTDAGAGEEYDADEHRGVHAGSAGRGRYGSGGEDDEGVRNREAAAGFSLL